MDDRLLRFCLLLNLLCLGWARNQNCLTSASSCDKCIQSGLDCACCIDPQYKTRCNTLKMLKQAGFSNSHVYNPKDKLLILRYIAGMNRHR